MPQPLQVECALHAAHALCRRWRGEAYWMDDVPEMVGVALPVMQPLLLSLYNQLSQQLSEQTLPCLQVLLKVKLPFRIRQPETVRATHCAALGVGFTGSTAGA